MRVRRTEAGAAAIEMALVMPFLLLLLCGIIDFGRGYHAQLTLAHAARESVRVWALGGTRSEVDTRAADTTRTVGDIDGVVAVPEPPGDECTFGQEAKVTVTGDFVFLTPFIEDLAPASLSAEGVMRCGG